MPATEGANSHERSGPVLHTINAVWRVVTPVTRRRSKARGRFPAPNLSGTEDRGSGKQHGPAVLALTLGAFP